MGLFDTFTKPKWQHKNPKVRLEGVKELDNQEILYEIAKNDTDCKVRMEAVNRITDQSCLSDIAKNDEDYEVSKEALKRIDDEAILIDIAKNNSSISVREEAVSRINDVDALVEIARHESQRYIRNDALSKVNDEQLLKELMNEDNPQLRKSAFSRLQSVNPEEYNRILNESRQAKIKEREEFINGKCKCGSTDITKSYFTMTDPSEGDIGSAAVYTCNSCGNEVIDWIW